MHSVRAWTVPFRYLVTANLLAINGQRQRCRRGLHATPAGLRAS